MIPTFKLNPSNISPSGIQILMRSRMNAPAHGNVIWVPKRFTLEKSIFCIENSIVEQDGLYIYDNRVDTYYLCAVLNSASYKRKLFGNNLRPFATYDVDLKKLLSIDILMVDTVVQQDISILEVIIQFMYHKELSNYQKSIREYMISVFEDVRDALFLEILFPLFFQANHLNIRNNWSSALVHYGSANHMIESIDVLFKLITDNKSLLGNNLKRLKMLLNSLPKR